MEIAVVSQRNQHRAQLFSVRETQNLAATFSGDIRNGQGRADTLLPGSAEELQQSWLGKGFPNWLPSQLQDVPALTACQDQGCPGGTPWGSQALHDLRASLCTQPLPSKILK